MELIKYAFLNGFYYLGTICIQQWYWLIGLVIFIALIHEENRVIEDEFVDEMRDIY